MKRWIQGSVVAALAISTSMLAVGCDKGEAKDTKETTTKAAPAEAASSTAGPTKPAADTTDKAADQGGEADEAAALLGAAASNKGEESGVLNVDLSGIDSSKAPALGGGAPPPAAGGAPVEWLAAGPIAIPNPGWKKQIGKEGGLLISPDNKALVIFTDFDTPANGLKMVDKIVARLKVTNAKWQKPKVVNVGPSKLPGMVGVGHGTALGGKGATLFYLLVKTGAPKNLLAIGGADDDAPKQDLLTGLRIVGNLKKQ